MTTSYSTESNLVQPLTPREKEIAALMGKGWDCKRIANALGIKPPTVRRFVEQIAAKLTNPEEIRPSPLVALWAARQNWERELQLQASAALPY